MMQRKFETLIDEAIYHTDQAGAVKIEFSQSESQIAISYSLIAIAQELHRMNERQADEIEKRLDSSEAKLERWAAEAEANFAE